MVDTTNTDTESTGSGGGWRSQSPLLKVLLLVSLVCVVFGVYRCSAELTPTDGPRTVRVERATISVPDSLMAAPADSVAALATRMFARGLRESGSADVVVTEDPSAWATVRLHIRGITDGRIELNGSASSVLGGRRMAAVTAEGSIDQLREMTVSASADMAEQLGIVNGSPVEGR